MVILYYNICWVEAVVQNDEAEKYSHQQSLSKAGGQRRDFIRFSWLIPKSVWKQQGPNKGSVFAVL